MVVGIASEGSDTEFESHLNCLLREREILRMRRSSATRMKKNIIKKSKAQKRSWKLYFVRRTKVIASHFWGVTDAEDPGVGSVHKRISIY